MREKIKRTLFSLGLFMITLTASAQHVYFIGNGRIEYEKKVNLYAKIKAMVNQGGGYTEDFYEQYRRNNPQFATSTATLDFSMSRSIYQPKEEETLQNAFMNPWTIVKNKVATDFASDSTTTLKNMIEEEYLIKEKKREILWKITTETREIAGFSCRRANGLIMDSVYVVAFYTDEILPSGGPESFSGLPGMILGVALPHENVTWFATKVEINKVSPPKLKTPAKLKAMTRQEFEESLSKLSSWYRNQEARKAFGL